MQNEILAGGIGTIVIAAQVVLVMFALRTSVVLLKGTPPGAGLAALIW